MVALAGAALAVSCGDDTPEPPADSSTGVFDPVGIDCTPGAVLGCMCNNGQAGTQTCADNGSELSRCVCGEGGSLDTGDTGTDDDDDTDTDEPTGSPGQCGNGVVDEGEQCDDGNGVYDDACSNDCIAECGLGWEVRFGKEDPSSAGEDIAVGPDASVVVVGTEDQGIESNIWLARFDAEGNELWSQSIDNASTEAGEAVAVDEDGNIVVVASIAGADGSDIWVAMIDPDGNEIWSDTHDGAADGDDFGGGAAFDADGNAIVSGTVRDADGDSDVWVRKYSRGGNAQWTETFSGAGNGTFSIDAGEEVAVDGDGNIYVSAEIYVDFDEQDAQLLKYGPNGGAPEWTRAPLAGGAAHEHSPAGVGVDADGNVVFGIRRDNTSVAATFWLFKYDADGGETWMVDAESLEIGNRHFLDGLGVADSGRIGLVMTEDPEMEDLRVRVATIEADGTPGCDDVIALDLGIFISAGGTVDSAGNTFATGLVSVNGTAQQRWLARFRGAATTE